MNVTQIICIFPNKFQLGLYSTQVSSQLGVEIIPAESSDEALSFLSILPDIPLVVFGPGGVTAKSFNQFMAFLKDNKLEKKIISFGPVPGANENFIKVVDPNSKPEDLVEIIKGELPSDFISSLKEGSTYNQVKLDLLAFFSHAVVPFYIQVGKNIEGAKFLKMVNKGAEFKDEDIEKFRKKGLSSLFIKKEDYPTFANALNKLLMDKLKESNPKKNSQKELTSSIHQVVFDKINTTHREIASNLVSVGMKGEEIAFAQEAISKVMTSLEKSCSLIGGLTLMIEAQGSYSFRHSYTQSIVAYNILKVFGWTTPSYVEPLLFSSFFHDTILEKEEYIVFDDEEELAKSKLSEKEKEIVKTHALEAFNYIGKLQNVPLGADVIIKQHHGSETGIGFPTKISNQLHPIAFIFLVSEAFTKKILTSANKKIDILKVVNEISAKYKCQQIAPTISALKKALVDSSG